MELTDCDASSARLEPRNVSFVSLLSRFTATHCAVLSMDVLVNSSVALNLHMDVAVSFADCNWTDSSLELSSGLLSSSASDVYAYSNLPTLVSLTDCDFASTAPLPAHMIKIYANDEWLPSITFADTSFSASSRAANGSLILVSTAPIENETDDEAVPLARSSIRFRDCWTR